MKQAPFTFTSRALFQINELKNKLSIADNQFLRVGIKGGGCAGFSFLLAFDFKEENDEIYTYENLEIVVKKSHTMHVVGMEIDFNENEQESGFVFTGN